MAHFDEVGVCGECMCEHFQPPGVRLRDLIIPGLGKQTDP